MEAKNLKKKIRFELSAGSQQEVQKQLEEWRQMGVLIDQLPIINNSDVKMCVNQFRFIQKDIRPVVDDSAWSLAVYYLYVAARRRIKRQREESGRCGEQCSIFPFRLRFIGQIKGVKTIVVAENPMEIKSDQEFESRLKEVLNKYREFLAALFMEENSMLFDFELTMQTIEYSYAHENIYRLD